MHVPRAWADPLVQPKQCKRDVRYSTWNVRSLYKSSSLKTAAKELVRCKLDLVGVQEIIFFFYGKGNKNHLFEGFFVHHGIVTAVKGVKFLSVRMSYIVLEGCWCNIIVLNVHAPSEEKSDDSKDSFYEELEQLFNHFPK